MKLPPARNVLYLTKAFHRIQNYTALTFALLAILLQFMVSTYAPPTFKIN